MGKTTSRPVEDIKILCGHTDIKNEYCQEMIYKMNNYEISNVLAELLKCIGRKFSKLLEILHYPHTINNKLGNCTINNIYILYFRKWHMDPDCSISYCSISYSLFVGTSIGWKNIVVAGDKPRSYGHYSMALQDVKMLRNTVKELIFVSTLEFYPGVSHYFHHYKVIDTDKIIYSYFCDTESELIIHPISNLSSKFVFSVVMNRPFIMPKSNINYQEVFTHLLTDSEKYYITKISAYTSPLKTLDVNIYTYINSGNLELILSTYMLEKYDRSKCFLEYTDYLELMYYTFLPLIELVKIRANLMFLEMKLIDDVLNILRGENEYSYEPLSLLLLRAVVLEHSLMLFRKMIQT